MRNISANSDLSPEQRFHAVGAILARGVVRYYCHKSRLDFAHGKNFPDTSPGCLEVLGKTRLGVSKRTRRYHVSSGGGRK
jgi:hypothetical protein